MKSRDDTKRKFEIAELAWVSNAFLLAAQELCEAVVEDPPKDHAHRSRVPLYLAHHALELLFKAALLEAGVAFKATHSVMALRQLCLTHAPDCAFDVPEWLKQRNEAPDPTGDLFPAELLRELPAPLVHDLHERLRYVTDRKGTVMEPPPDPEAKLLYQQISELQRRCLKPLLRLTS